MKIGVVGLGRMGSRGIVAVKGLACDLVAAYDPAESPFALGVHPELAEVWTREEEKFWAIPMDAVLIMSTAPTHVAALMRGLETGIRRFLVEKAFCTGVEQGKAALAAVRDCGARVVVNHGRRYCPNYSKLQSLVGTPEMGDLRSIAVTMGAGGLGCMGAHHIETCNRFLGGLPLRVYALGTGGVPPNPRGKDYVDPGASALLEYPEGRRAFLEIADDTGLHIFSEYCFTLGRVAADDNTGLWQKASRAPRDRSLPLTHYGQPLSVTQIETVEFGVQQMLVAALENLFSNDVIQSPIEIALDTVCVIVALRRSLELRQPIELPLSAEDESLTFNFP